MRRRMMTCGLRNPYVTDGLVAMWDGIWNAGLGKHSSTATTWKDIVSGDETSPISGAFLFTNNAMRKATGNRTYFQLAIEGIEECKMSVEVVCRVSETDRKIYNGLAATYGYSSGQGNFGLTIKNNWVVMGTANTPYQSCSEVGYNAGSLAGVAELLTFTNVFDTNQYTLFLDGETITTQTATMTEVPPKIHFCTSGDPSKENVYGDYHCIRFYNRVLSAEEVAHNAQVDAVRFGIT